MTDPATTLRLADAVRALADECEGVPDGTPDLGRRIAKVMGAHIPVSMCYSWQTAIFWLQGRPWWEILYSADAKTGKPYFVSLSCPEYRIRANAATLPLAVCAAMLLLEEQRLRREAAGLPWNEPGEGEPDV